MVSGKKAKRNVIELKTKGLPEIGIVAEKQAAAAGRLPYDFSGMVIICNRRKLRQSGAG